MALEWRSFDGRGNNQNEFNSDFGAADTSETRWAPASTNYLADFSETDPRPSAREISNVVSSCESTAKRGYWSDFVWIWGQFIDHDIVLTVKPEQPGEVLKIDVPAGDPYFDPTGTGRQFIPLIRSIYNIDNPDNVRTQINGNTAFLDGSAVYGSDEITANSLRQFSQGKLKTAAITDNGKELLPISDGSNPYTNTKAGQFEAGDNRASENIGLSAIQTIFLREHNRIAGEIYNSLDLQNESEKDQVAYQTARAYVIAEIQHITYYEYLPALLGENIIGEYKGYDANISPNISTEFASAGYRFGHSTIHERLRLINESGEPLLATVNNQFQPNEEVNITIASSPDEYGVRIKNDFNDPKLFVAIGADAILKGAAAGQIEEVDTHIVDDLRNFLFGAPGQGGFDLFALNIERGRDHQIADYNSTRIALGLTEIKDFSDITTNTELANKLRDLYGTVNNIDLFVGGLAEDKAADSVVGETFRSIIAKQFEAVRTGDRFWYENGNISGLTNQQQSEIKDQTLSKLIARNSGLSGLRENLFNVGIEGTSGDDLIESNAPEAGKIYLGYAGNDTIKGRLKTDHLLGGKGEDTADYSASNKNIDINLTSGKATGPNDNESDTLVSIEDARGGSGDDTITGNKENNKLFGGIGNDHIYSGDGDDYVDAGDGNDLIVGGDGKGDDIYLGGAGIDTVKYSSSLNHPITVNLRTGIAVGEEIGHDTLESIENVIAGQVNDVIIGSIDDNRIDGLAGTDTVVFQGESWQYDITRGIDGSTTVIDNTANRDGTDTLLNVEVIRFSNENLLVNSELPSKHASFKLARLAPKLVAAPELPQQEQPKPTNTPTAPSQPEPPSNNNLPQPEALTNTVVPPQPEPPSSNNVPQPEVLSDTVVPPQAQTPFTGEANSPSDVAKSANPVLPSKNNKKQTKQSKTSIKSPATTKTKAAVVGSAAKKITNAANSKQLHPNKQPSGTNPSKNSLATNGQNKGLIKPVAKKKPSSPVKVPALNKATKITASKTLKTGAKLQLQPYAKNSRTPSKDALTGQAKGQWQVDMKDYTTFEPSGFITQLSTGNEQQTLMRFTGSKVFKDLDSSNTFSAGDLELGQLKASLIESSSGQLFGQTSGPHDYDLRTSNNATPVGILSLATSL